MPKTDPLDVIAEICHDQPHDALSRIADVLGYTEGSIVLTPKDAAFLGARLRRLFAHFKVAVPDGGDDARLIGHAAAGIGLLLTAHTHGVPVAPAPKPREDKFGDPISPYYPGNRNKGGTDGR